MTNISRHIRIFGAAALIFVVLGGARMSQAAVNAVTFQSLPDAASYNDFVVGPGKIEAELAPGQSQTFQLTIANRLGTDKAFSLSVQDIKGSDDPNQAVVLLGDDRGPYSLKDYLHAATTTIVVPQGERATIPVTVSVPADAQPGGLYGSVVVGTVSTSGAAAPVGGALGQSPVVTQIGTLFFVTVEGAVEPDGQLSGFSLAGGKDAFFDGGPIDFDILFKNSGTVNLDPQGTITVTNLLGAPVGTVTAEPWFALPGSLRFRQVEWDPGFLFGRYVAHLALQRGYGSTTDQADVAFWVIPWKILLGALAIIIVIVALVRWIASRFSIVARKKI